VFLRAIKGTGMTTIGDGSFNPNIGKKAKCQCLHLPEPWEKLWGTYIGRRMQVLGGNSYGTRMLAQIPMLHFKEIALKDCNVLQPA